MNENKFFLHQIKRNGTTITKGIVVADTYAAALQGYHAYLGAYAYGHEAGTDFVSCEVTDMSGARLIEETWLAPQPEPNEE